ncbi:hypothetical protein N7513_000256 [Penicillium frequentans]|nr:hypothetical protein N7513_000256 [Penicillium glabrum]
MDFFRDSAMGQIIRYLAEEKILLYIEEQKEFFDQSLANGIINVVDDHGKVSELPDALSAKACNSESDDIECQTRNHNTDKATTSLGQQRCSSDPNLTALNDSHDLNPHGHGQQKLRHGVVDFKKELSTSNEIVIDWYSDADPENPQNWTSLKNGMVLFQLCAYTMAVYGASSMYVPSEEGVMKEFDVGATPAALGLAVYVAGYGVGPLIFAPLSEIPSVGRNWVYIPTFFIFVILSIPTATVRSFAGLLVLRFLTGFFGSPCLANGGASVGDIYPTSHIPIYLSSWTAVWFWGPAIGPVVAGFAVQAKGWRWGLWEIVWLTGPLSLLLFCALPETSSDNILRRRAQRLRKLTGRSNIFASSEIAQAQLTTVDVVWDALMKPAEIMFKDPAVLFTNLYTSLTYGIYYSFFEAFPLVYPTIYGFNIGETGLCFLTIGIACIIGIVIFFAYQFCYVLPDFERHGPRAPEHRLVPALFAVITLSVG